MKFHKSGFDTYKTYRYKVIGGDNYDGVEVNDLMGTGGRSKGAVVTGTSVSAIGNYILSQKKLNGVLKARNLNLDDVPAENKLNKQPPPVDMDKNQMNEQY